MQMQTSPTVNDLEAAVVALGPSPQNEGTLAMIVRRPANSEREVLETAELETTVGMVGDNWHTRGSRHTEDGNAHPDMQIAVMNSRIIQAIAGERERWPLAGDQLFIDMDLSAENMPVGQRFAVGTAILEVTPLPHNGCDKFTARFGSDATRFVNSKTGRALRRRGINARVVQGGTVRVGDTVSKIDPAE